MHNNNEQDEHDGWAKRVAGEADAMIHAGLTGTIRVHQPTLWRANRALLEKSFISSDNETYFWIKTHYQALKKWHRLHTGWYVERRNDLFRLMRQPSMLTSGYSDSKCLLHSARDFVYVLWILWYAANDQIVKWGNGQLFLLLQMLERLSEEWKLAGCIDVLTLGEKADFSDQPLAMSNRKSMARALKYLQGLQCLKELDGQIDVWIERDKPVLYQFTNAIHFLITSLDPVALEAAVVHQRESIIFTPTVFTIQKEKQDALTRAWRALLIGPFLLKFDDPEAFVALTDHINEVREELDVSFGWSLEVNHDYACIIRDVPSSPSMILLSLKCANDQVVLLLCDELRSQVAAGTFNPDYYGCIRTRVSDLLDLFASMRERFEAHWGKGMREKGNKELLADALKKMRRIGFIRGPDSKNNVLILPTIARYSVQYMEELEDASSSGSKRKGRGEKDDFYQTNLWTDEEENN